MSNIAPYLEFDLPDPEALGDEWNFTDRSELLFRRGHHHWSHGFFDKALACFEDAQRYDHTHVQAAVSRCEMLVLLGQVDQASDVVNAALDRFGRNAELGAARGHVYLHQNDLDHALQCCDTATALAPDNAYAWIITGEVRLALEDALWSAQEGFHTARECVFLWPYMELRIALAFLEWGYVRECALALRSILRLQNNLPYLWILLGDTCQLMGQHRRAEMCLRRALRLEPDLVRLHKRIGWRGFFGRCWSGFTGTARTIIGTLNKD
jgi:tetratricopeptide (TPR) repeat protein